jgi:hypothetical protein
MYSNVLQYLQEDTQHMHIFSSVDCLIVFMQILLWSLQSEKTYISTSAQSWVDDYFSWMATCCKYDKAREQVCQSDYFDFNEGLTCKKCSTRGITGFGQVGPLSEDQFQEHVAWFLEDAPGIQCATAGKGAYRDAVR